MIYSLKIMLNEVSTPHIEAKIDEIAKTVLMPGDPLRAKFIAENYLTDVKCFNRVRNVLGFTGKYKGKLVSVMGSGMGMPSIGIYSHELYNFYNVENIIRIGSAGSVQDNINLKDIVISMGACTDSNYVNKYGLNGTFSAIASYDLLNKVTRNINNINYKCHIGNVLSSDIFYSDNEMLKKWKNLGILVVEMELAALYMNAAEAGKNALGILTVSDHIFRGEALTSKEREVGFCDMVELTLNSVLQE